MNSAVELSSTAHRERRSEAAPAAKKARGEAEQLLAAANHATARLAAAQRYERGRELQPEDVERRQPCISQLQAGEERVVGVEFSVGGKMHHRQRWRP